MSIDDRKIFLTVVGPEEVIRSLSAMEKTDAFSVSEPQPVDSLADAVDAVLGPDKIGQLMEFATVTLQLNIADAEEVTPPDVGADATIAFISALKKQLASVDTTEKPRVLVRDGMTNDEILIVDESTEEAGAKKAIESSTTK